MADNELFGNSEQLDCSDCVDHGGDWDCDHVQCRKGTDTISRQAAVYGKDHVANPNKMVEDLISRAETITLFEKYGAEEDAIALLSSLPSAQQWIPISEGLPEMTDTYLVQVGVNENGEGMHTEARTADWNAVWQTWYVHTTRCLVGDIIKWMPIPWEGSDRHEG